MGRGEWYEALAKPDWTPAPATLQLIWWILYPVIAVTFGAVFVQVLRGRWPPRIALPFAVNLAANLAFTPILFGLRDLRLAAADVLIVWATLPWMAAAVWPRSRLVAVAQIPYFAWVSIAVVLQLSITALNR